MGEVVVRDIPERHRFEAYLDGALAGFTTYELVGEVMVILHAEVDPAFEGQGVGSAMVRQLLDDLRAREGLKVKVLCPFVNAWLRRHPDYQEVVDR